MNTILIISLILSILYISQSLDNDSFYQNKKINFYELSQKNIDCLYYYQKNVNNSFKNINNIPFYEYLEYWWNVDESGDELLDRVCTLIYSKYQKKNIRRSINN
jgi:hypothetical protein